MFTLPPALHFDSLDSTNEEALRLLASGHAMPVWIIAAEQTRGRGRGGRHWESPKGNLYATLLMQTKVSAATATQLSFVAALAAHDAIAAHLVPAKRPRLKLKWPNDVLLDGAKVAGILLESLAGRQPGNLAVILGVGINVSHAPILDDRRVACLGLKTSAVESIFSALATTVSRRLDLWREGRGFEQIRQAWLERAIGLNEIIAVHVSGNAIRGRFKGVDTKGALQLETEPGVVVTVTAGDIYPDLTT
jgi:BirA family transcriptional regulator, biotin operon repressor / biotin---[acetyl-CoA-carboxylase] ligase